MSLSRAVSFVLAIFLTEALALTHAELAQKPAGDRADQNYASELPYIPPEIRDGADELVAGEKGTLPALVSREDIRGDLHMHSLWSDGRDTIETMVAECHAIGYEYIAITDHSPHSAASRNLTLDGALLDGMTINGGLAVNGRRQVSVKNGLTLNSTFTVGTSTAGAGNGNQRSRFQVNAAPAT